MPKSKLDMEVSQVLKLGSLYLCFSLSSVSESQEICIQARSATLLTVIRLKSMKGQGQLMKANVQSHSQQQSWMQLWIQHRIQQEHLRIKDLLGPVPQAWWLWALERQCEASSGLKPSAATSLQFPVVHFPHAPPWRWDLQPLSSAAISSLTSSSLSVFKGIFFLYLKKSFPAPLLSPSLS